MAHRLTIPSEALRARRLAAVLSREDLAAKADVSAGTIKAIEQGATQSLRPQTVRKLADALGCDPQDISQVVEVAAS